MTLVVFLTRGLGISNWIKVGIYNREILLYKYYLDAGYFSKVIFISYCSNDIRLFDNLRGMCNVSKDFQNYSFELHAPQFKITQRLSLLYSIFIPIKYYRIFKTSNCFKTNQLDNGFLVPICKLFFSQNILVRGGYSKSHYLYRKNSKIRLKYLAAKWVESLSVRYASHVIISNYPNYNFLYNNLFTCNKYSIIPTFIPEIFKKNKSHFERKENSFIYVGRLEKDKGVMQLVETFINSDFNLTIIGDGSCYEDLCINTSKINNVKIIRRIDNASLPYYYNDHKYFISLSENEGLPKALLEALACGCICIVSGGLEYLINISKVDNFIFTLPQVNSNVNDLKKFLLSVVFCKDNDYYSEESAKYILRNYSLNTYAEQEFNLLERFS